ncbi:MULTISPECIES: hypothetical protein [unclassified Streptomyces]|uniref:hypothetical protein n=1 Tax=unclassified Streptomyces TaxID=2593676 RepID=UPI0033BB073C
MKYLVTVQGSQAGHEAMAGRGSAGGPAWGEPGLRAMFDRMNAITAELGANGERLDAQALAAPSTARFVTVDETGPSLD